MPSDAPATAEKLLHDLLLIATERNATRIPGGVAAAMTVCLNQQGISNQNEAVHCCFEGRWIPLGIGRHDLI